MKNGVYKRMLLFKYMGLSWVSCLGSVKELFGGRNKQNRTMNSYTGSPNTSLLWAAVGGISIPTVSQFQIATPANDMVLIW